MTLGRAAFVGLLVGCPGEEPPDGAAARAAYLAVVSQRDVEPEAGLAACAAIEDDRLAGDCGLYVVSVEARRRDGRPGQWCASVAEGTWRDECWFVSAEASKRARKLAEAAKFCMEAGAFKDDCAQHLWQSEVRGLIHRRGSEGFGEVLDSATTVHARWSPLLAEVTDFDDRFWAKFYQNGFEGRGGFVDLGHCDVLPAPHAVRCVAAGTEMYARELSPRLGDVGREVCSLPVPDDGRWSEALVEWVPTAPDARLDAVVVARRESCGG